MDESCLLNDKTVRDRPAVTNYNHRINFYTTETFSNSIIKMRGKFVKTGIK